MDADGESLVYLLRTLPQNARVHGVVHLARQTAKKEWLCVVVVLVEPEQVGLVHVRKVCRFMLGLKQILKCAF